MFSAWLSSLANDEGFGHFAAAGEDFAEQFIPEGVYDGADLVRGDHVAVELAGVVSEVVVEFFPAGLAGVAFLLFHEVAGFDLAARLGDGGLDAVDVVVDVDTVGHGHFVVVFHHQVLVEEAEGLLAGRGGEADEVGVEVFQHLRPQVVDGAVGFVGDDDVEGLDGDAGIVFDGLGLLEQRAELVNGFFFQVGRQVFPLRDCSRLRIAVIWAGQRPASCSGGMDCSRARKVLPTAP